MKTDLGNAFIATNFGRPPNSDGRVLLADDIKKLWVYTYTLTFSIIFKPNFVENPYLRFWYSSEP